MPVTPMFTDPFARDRYGLPIRVEKSHANSDSRSPSPKCRDLIAKQKSSNTAKRRTGSSHDSNTITNSDNTAMVAPKGFLDLPAEVRNEIYKSALATPDELGNHVIRAENILRSMRSLDPEANVALELAQLYPFLLTSKTIRQEAFNMCLGACTLHFDLTRGGNAVLYHGLKAFFDSDLARPLQCTKYIRSVSVLLSKYTSWDFYDLGNHLAYPWISILQSLCPDLEKLEIQLTDHTADQSQHITTHFERKDALAKWPALREVRVRNLELEVKVRREQRRFSFENPFSLAQVVSEGVGLPFPRSTLHLWHLDMEVRFIEQVNEDLARVLWEHRIEEAKKAKGEEGNGA